MTPMVYGITSLHLGALPSTDTLLSPSDEVTTMAVAAATMTPTVALAVVGMIPTASPAVEVLVEVVEMTLTAYVSLS